MQVTPEYAFSNIEEIAALIESGEIIEIPRVGKPTLQLILDRSQLIADTVMDQSG